MYRAWQIAHDVKKAASAPALTKRNGLKKARAALGSLSPTPLLEVALGGYYRTYGREPREIP
jgi:hypothetical protein